MSNKFLGMNRVHFKEIVLTSWQYAEDFEWEIIALKESLSAKKIGCFEAILNVSILKVIMPSLVPFLMLFQGNIFFNAICFALRSRKNSSVGRWLEGLANSDINRVNRSVSIKVTSWASERRNHVRWLQFMIEPFLDKLITVVSLTSKFIRYMRHYVPCFNDAKSKQAIEAFDFDIYASNETSNAHETQTECETKITSYEEDSFRQLNYRKYFHFSISLLYLIA
jgi:hypothetical protein